MECRLSFYVILSSVQVTTVVVVKQYLLRILSCVSAPLDTQHATSMRRVVVIYDLYDSTIFFHIIS